MHKVKSTEGKEGGGMVITSFRYSLRYLSKLAKPRGQGSDSKLIKEPKLRMFSKLMDDCKRQKTGGLKVNGLKDRSHCLRVPK